MRISTLVVLGWSALVAGGCAQPEPACQATIDAWADDDGDGFGGASLGKVCALEAGQVDQPLDCDDADPERHPDAKEACNGIDDDCDGAIDQGLPKLQQFWIDEDGDGYGGAYQSVLACKQPDGYVDEHSDCDDSEPSVNPGATERCGNGDDDCDGFVDDDDDDTDPESMTIYYRDADRDGAGNPEVTRSACLPPSGWTATGGDCDDNDASFIVDTFYQDEDEDGYGAPNTTVKACELGPGLSEDGSDCDDQDPDVHEVAGWLRDLDGDGFGSGDALVTQCSYPGGDLVSATGGLDCADDDATRYPGAREICEDGIDQNCDGHDIQCGPIGSFRVGDGPDWGTDPPVYSCLDACALIFGGVPTDYHCSTNAVTMNQLAYLSGWGDTRYCSNGAAEDYKLEPAGNPGYNCGSGACSFSAYVRDHCTTSVNYCWHR
ncbi:MAG: putative metal-binding motif-containing protein [Myxococcales bacterium]|nr:putative metal-binding motif-containing protein [Myxococcales bacterium]